MAGISQGTQPVAEQRMADEYLAGNSGLTDKVLALKGRPKLMQMALKRLWCWC